MSERPYDLVLFGATGFTGRLVAEELARTAGSLRWALAGRDPERLLRLKQALIGIDRSLGHVGLIEADVSRPASLRKACRKM